MAACGGQSGNEQTQTTGSIGSAQSGDPVTLQWCATYLEPEVVHKYVDQFNEMHDRITVQVIDATYGSVSDYTAALALLAAYCANKAPGEALGKRCSQRQRVL